MTPPGSDGRGASLGGLRAFFGPVTILMASNVLAAAAGGVFFLAASARFDLAGMGLYGAAISLQWVVVGLLGGGLAVAAVRLAAERVLEKDLKRAAGIVLGAGGLAASIAVLGAGVCRLLPGSTWAATGLGSGLVALAFLWAGSRSTLDCFRSGLLAQRSYVRAAALTIISGLTGLAALAVVWFTDSFTLPWLLTAHVAGLATGALLGLLLLRPLASQGIDASREVMKPVVRYAVWPSLSEGTRLALANVGPFVLLWASTPAEAGLFAVGRYPAYLFEVIAVSLYQFWLPEVSRRTDPRELRSFVGKQMVIALGVGAGMVVAALAAQPFLPLLGEHFAAAAPLLLLNTGDFALFLAVRPLESAFHALKKPHLELWMRLARLPLLLALALPMAQSHGAAGMVWAHVIVGGAALLLAAVVAYRALRRA